ncbi:hypothetical protein BO82DRAFT_397378 [Aspergillus uvarum CBS 121591]|uniref:Uncharacterized protein n=1 Tax=Aspergillus uvarum CBS 121591 TaxID=1448315 RepID=A0A319CQD6_9EURO|nr:hypothetical protein BO82DRAFT_397378 [Aspergillus uvarum CBS 121591]PYH86810.1 hypothetical protein BO82DRAFT_397378 [Aspergillus uvarum CBS 121591]
MVGWLMNDDEKNDTGKLHVHISQNRHEIFITFVEYDARYLAYLKNPPVKNEVSKPGNSQSKPSASQAPETGVPSFLTMHQYGPWDTQQRSHMKNLGPILLAIALYAEGEVRARPRSQRG